jgi:hypothetical protein
VPRRAVGLGASLLGPACSPLTLLGGSVTSDPSARRSLHRLSSSDPGSYLGRRRRLHPLCPCPRGWGHGGVGAGRRTGGWGTSSRCIEDPDPAVGVLAAGLVNRHAALVKGRQRGQDCRPQPWVVAERMDVLGEDRGLRDEGFPSNPSHQDCQLVPGQVGAWPMLDPDDVVRAGEPTAQARSPLQRRDPALQEVADHLHRCQAARSQALDPVQYGQEL